MTKCKNCGHEKHDGKCYYVYEAQYPQRDDVCPCPVYEPETPEPASAEIENKPAHIENAAVYESMEPLTEAEQKYLKRIFFPTPEQMEIESEIDRVVDLLADVRSRYCELEPDCGIDEVLKALIKDRDLAYQQINELLKPDPASAKPDTSDIDAARAWLIDDLTRFLNARCAQLARAGDKAGSVEIANLAGEVEKAIKLMEDKENEHRRC